MKIISRYVLKHFIPVFCLALTAFCGIYLVIDFFERVDDILEKQVSVLESYSYFLYKIPLIICQGIPMATLLASLIALGILKRNRELIAMRAAGVSPSVYTLPILFAAAVLAIVNFTMADSFARTMNQKAKHIWEEKILQHKATVHLGHEDVWYRGKNAIYQIRYYDVRNKALLRVSIFYVDPEFNLVKRLDAKSIEWRNGRWLAKDGSILSLTGTDAKQEAFKSKILDLPETPKDFSGIETVPEELSWLDLYRYTRKVREEGYNPAPYEVELNVRTAMPFTTLVLAMLGVSIALRQSLQGGTAIAVGLALIVSSLYLAVLQLGSSLATAGILPPIIGVWSGNFIFAALAGCLWMTDPG